MQRETWCFVTPYSPSNARVPPCLPLPPQGATLTGGTIIHARSVFTPGQLYVMLSRVTERRLLRLVGPLRPDLFTPVRLPNFVQIDALAEKQRALQAAAFAAAATAVLVATATHPPVAPAMEPTALDGLD